MVEGNIMDAEFGFRGLYGVTPLPSSIRKWMLTASCAGSQEGNPALNILWSFYYLRLQ